jgi:hypothetical protein
MAEQEDAADRASQEIKALLKRLDPKGKCDDNNDDDDDGSFVVALSVTFTVSNKSLGLLVTTQSVHRSKSYICILTYTTDGILLVSLSLFSVFLFRLIS